MSPSGARYDLSIALSNYLNLCALGDIRYNCSGMADDLLNDTSSGTD